MTQHIKTEEDHQAFLSFRNFASSLTNYASTVIWNTYILQMSHAESAVHHIILSTGYLLRASMPDAEFQDNPIIRVQKKNMVFYHYGKALHALINNPHPDVNIVLLSCLIFCLFEELQGNCYAALRHIVAGRDILLKHLRSLKPSARRNDKLNSINVSPSWHPLLVQLLQTYSQLEMHTAVLEGRAINSHIRLPLSGFSQQEVTSYNTAHQQRLPWTTSRQLLPVNTNAARLPSPGLDGNPPRFGNIADASQYLARLAAIVCNSDADSGFMSEITSRWRTNFLLPSRETVLLNYWLEAFNEMMLKSSPNEITTRDLIDSHVLRTYHSCLALLNRATDLGQEAVFDDNLVFFDLTMFRITILIPVLQEELIPPLFFVATRCRVGYVRHRAVGLLQQCGLEGQFLADVAVQIIEREESFSSKDEIDEKIDYKAHSVEESRLRLHGIQLFDDVTMSPGYDADVAYLMVSKVPYAPRAPITPLMVHLPSLRKNEFFDKADSCLKRALHFEMYSSMS